ncbi:MAG: hypothetical protein QXR60_01140 [Candidatus Nanoarchaeia archaeon]
MFKRAVLAPVFKYIFVMVAGGIILLFFVKFAMDMVSTGEKVTSAELGYLFDESLNALSVSEDQSEPIPGDPWPSDITINVGVGPNCGKFSSGGSWFSANKIIFSPSILKGRQLLAWTQSWYYPFEVDNFYFLTVKRSKYYLVYPSDSNVMSFVKSIDSIALPSDTLEHIPKSFDVESIPESQVVGKLGSAAQYDFVKFVFFKNAKIPANFNARYVKIDYSECEADFDDDDCRGKVDFPNGKSSFFVGKPMLYGAIFTDDYETYNCQLSRIYSRLSLMSEFYSKKADFLSHPSKFPSCELYSAVKTNLASIKNLAESKSTDYVQFQTVKDALIESNNNLGDDSACMVLF